MGVDKRMEEYWKWGAFQGQRDNADFLETAVYTCVFSWLINTLRIFLKLSVVKQLLTTLSPSFEFLRSGQPILAVSLVFLPVNYVA